MGRQRSLPKFSDYFRVDFFKHKNITFEIWDLDGRDDVRVLWRHYLANTSCIFFVLDSTDRDHINEAKDLIHSICSNEQLKSAGLVVIANKQDLPGAMNVSDIETMLDLQSFDSSRQR